MFYLYHLNMFSYVELKPNFIIGRGQGDLVFADDQRMSGSHLKITYSSEDKLAFVEDLGSKNKTVVNRIQIPANQKIRIKIFALIEAGSQQFILTDSKSLTIQNINEIMEHHLQKAIVKIDKEGTSSHINRVYQPSDEISAAEAEIQKLITEIDRSETTTKQQIQSLEEQKHLIIQTAQKKKNTLQQNLAKLQKELQEKKNNFEKFRSEVEQKKKKVINLSELPDDLTKEPSK